MGWRFLAIFVVVFGLLAPAAWAENTKVQLELYARDGDGPLDGSTTLRICASETATPNLSSDCFASFPEQTVAFDAGLYRAEVNLLENLTAAELPSTIYYTAVINGDTLTPIESFAVPWALQALSLADGIVQSQNIASGAVTSATIAAGAVTSDDLSATGVTAGTYTLATITVGADGRITSASTGSTVTPSANTVTGTTIVNGSVTSQEVGTDLDFVNFDNALDLDASTTITLDGTEALSFVNNGGSSLTNAVEITSPAGKDPPSLIFSDADVNNQLGAIFGAGNTDVFGVLVESDTTAFGGSGMKGGLMIMGLSSTDQNPMQVKGIIGSNTPSNEAIRLAGSKLNSTSDNVTDIAATETLLKIYNNQTAQLTMRGNGNVGIGDSDPTEAKLVVNGDLFLNTIATANAERLCWDAAGGSLITDCNGTPGDYAEEYGTSDGGIEAGDIVAVDMFRPAFEVEENGLGSKAFAIKATQPYQSTLLGIVSTDPNETIGQNFDPSENPRPIALNGRVPVKVSTENGSIAIGDPITSSSVPGVGMKATRPGRIVGIALEPYDETRLDGKILVFVNVGWNGSEESARLRSLEETVKTLAAEVERLKALAPR